MKALHKKKLYRMLSLGLLGVFLIIAMFPVYWMINTSFKNDSEINRTVATFFPEKLNPSGYKELKRDRFFVALRNSLMVSLTVALMTLLLALPASYALSRLSFFGSRTISKSFLFAYMLPSAVMYLPMFIMLSRIKMTNSLGGLILIYPTLTIPYATWILIPYLRTIPRELEESAMVDGAGRVRSMLQIIFPLAIPGIMTTFVFCFTMCWSEYLYALINISSTKFKTFPLILAGLIKGDLYPWNEIMAGGTIACMPVVLIYMFASKYLIGGLTAGAVKG